MTICSECKTEYEGDKCPRCSTETKDGKYSRSNWVRLTTVANEIEFNIVKGLLETANIPAVRKVKGVDSIVEIVIGVPIAGVEVWVPGDKYEEASELMESTIVYDEEFEEDADNNDDGEDG